MTQVVDVFIASPSDVPHERRYTERAIQQVSGRTRDLFDVVLHPVMWDNFLPLATRGGHVQDRFSRRVRKCGIFIGILFGRYGTPIGKGRDLSGTEEEFQVAIECRHHIEILTYFRRKPATIQNRPNQLSQAARLADLKEHLKNKGLLVRRYGSPSEFKSTIALDLFETAARITNEVERRDQLRRFFKFGIRYQRQTPSVLLGYPTIHKHSSPILAEKSRSQGSPSRRNWQERLLPNVVYEDFKTIQKIETAVRFSGAQDISAVTLDQPRLERPGNRIWLCLPRNELAAQSLRRLRDRPRFQFKRGTNDFRHHIAWKKDGVAWRVESPLTKYLKIQGRPMRSPWRHSLGELVARDYAVLARFAIPDQVRLAQDKPFYHYFVAGIRGLGTWGAGWYIDRRPDELERLAAAENDSGNGDIQALLEVTFSNYRIVDVSDVSEKSPEYFADQLDPRTIAEVIQTYG